MLGRGAKTGILLAFALFLTGYSSIGLSQVDPNILKGSSAYASWQGIEPDKWATIWLIKRYISKDAYFLLTPPHTELPENTILFDVPDAAIGRGQQESMFHRLKAVMGLDTPSLNSIDQIIHDIEVNIWDAPLHPHSVWFETMFRQLQARYDRDKVPVDCYLTFFDEVLELSKLPHVTSVQYQDQLSLLSQCPGIKKNTHQFVGQVDHLDVLRRIGLGQNVVFIDTREDKEFKEVRIPGARLLRLRDVSEKTVMPYKNADLVVPYCVKDFRGFEVAKAMKLLGVEHVSTLSPNGLKGWIKAGLPVAKVDGANDRQALEALLTCTMSPHSCLDQGIGGYE